MLRNSLAVICGCCAAGTVLLAASAAAQDLAVQGRTPANPAVVISVPNTKSLWTPLKESPAGQILLSDVSLKDKLDVAEKERIEMIESSLGISLEPDSLMTETIAGLDYYLVDQPTGYGFVLNVAFTSADLPGKILDQVKREAQASEGVSGGVSADTVVDSNEGETRILALPAFEIYLAAEKDVLIYSNNRQSLDSAIGNQGRALFSSDYYNRYMSVIADEPAEAWVFGAMVDFMNLAEAKSAGTGMVMADEEEEEESDQVLAMKFHVTKEEMRVVAFQHQESMPPAQRRYAMSAPPPGDVSILSYFPQDASLAWGTNHFDGLSLLETLTEGLDDYGAPVDSEQINTQLQGMRTILGFDPRTDLLANIGPNLGIGVLPGQSISTMGASIPGFLFVAQVRDSARFEGVLNAVEQMVASASGAPEQKGMEMAKDEKKNENPAPAGSIASETIAGQKVSFITGDAQAAAGGVSPAWTLTTDGYFMLGSSKETIAASLGLDTNGALPTNSTFVALSGKTDDTINELGFAVPGSLADTLQANALLIGVAGGTPDALEKALTVLRSIKAMMATTTYTDNGKKTEFVLEM